MIPQLKNLRKELLNEAVNAPKLFKDLAKVEQYIAESYKSRALLELIQNADDAGATDFGLHSFRSGMIVGNNGRVFTIQDVEALCRSGSSNKQRGGSTIGYRGIGFKSVVNLAKRVFVFSGDFAFCFDKDRTQQILQSETDVPLIRIPHLAVEDFETEFVKEIFDIKDRFQFQTLFFFDELNERLSLADLSEFDSSSMMFLNHLTKAHLNFHNINRNIYLDKTTIIEKTIIRISESEKVDEWEIFSSKVDSANKIAFKLHEGTITSALPEESLIHSFTPTVEFAGAYLKINGDYTTDPSRKNIDMDELSQNSFKEAASLISNAVVRILSGEIVKAGFFTPFINASSENKRFRLLLFRFIEEELKHKQVKMADLKTVDFSSFRLKPDWLNYEDYQALCFSEFTPISKELLSIYPNLFTFLENLHFKNLSLDEIIERLNFVETTLIGKAQVFSKIVKQYRFDLDNAKLERLKRLKIFPVGSNFVNAEQIKMTSGLRPEFLEHISVNADESDTKLILKKLGIETSKQVVNDKKTPINTLNCETLPQKDNFLQKAFKAEPAIKKWRSAEQNAAEYLRALQNVLSVVDVSQANLGYDLEVLLINKKKVYVEVKSVSAFSEVFKITNNEYSSAHSYGNEYYIALVINDERFQMKFVPNPIDKLAFEKKCERWSWYCEQYKNQLQDEIS